MKFLQKFLACLKSKNVKGDKLYVACLVAQKNVTNGNTVSSNPHIFLVNAEADPEEVALWLCLRHFKPADGWYGHCVSTLEVPKEYIDAVSVPR